MGLRISNVVLKKKSLGREPILKEFDIINDLGEITVLEDIEINSKLPKMASTYLNELKENLTQSYKTPESNRNLKMEKAKIDHDRKIKKFDYKIGDLYKPGSENTVTDCFSRLPGEEEIESPENDYHENLVAVISTEEFGDTQTSSDSDSNAEVISQNPNY
ncbi:unnamed protein product [Brachionus calyciflorus]|uniref:Uncharacterized protein n=1 Tax=Brachionus calyciflorus TaxID=104777 RepID=A0A814B5A6_9BILA|nr:unnamed protein product [Brachionus calyciflorus]